MHSVRSLALVFKQDSNKHSLALAVCKARRSLIYCDCRLYTKSLFFRSQSLDLQVWISHGLCLLYFAGSDGREASRERGVGGREDPTGVLSPDM